MYPVLWLLVYILVDSRCWGEKSDVFKSCNGSRLAAAGFETAGQFVCGHVIGGNAAMAAPVIASCCTISAVLSRIILKVRLPRKQYACVTIVFLGLFCWVVLTDLP